MEEISLREIIEVIWKGKWFIAVFTAICIFISAIASLFFLKPVYEAHTTLMISPITDTKSENNNNNSFFGLVGSLSQYPQMTIDTYREQVKTSAILNDVVQDLGMVNADWTSIAGKVAVSAAKNTNLITISVKDNDPQMAAKMANAISERFSTFVSQTNQKQAEQSAQFIKVQQEKEKVNLEKAMEELKQFISHPRGPEELKLESESKLKQLTEFKTDVIQTKIDEQTVKSSLEQARTILNNTPKTISINKSMVSDALLSEILKDNTGTKTSDIAGLRLTEEEVNEIYIAIAQTVNELDVRLASLSVKRQNLENEIVARQKEIDAIQAELAEKKSKYDILNHNVELITQTYDAYDQKYKEAIIKQSADVGKSSIVVVSQALEPIKPVAPKKATNIAIAMVLGLMVSMFGVFAREYWRNSVITVGERDVTSF